jgi:hypothetical protein
LFHWLIFFNFSYSYGISVSPRFFEWVLVSTFLFKYIKLSHNYLIPATNLPLACRFGSIGEGLLRKSKLQFNSYKSSKGERIRCKFLVHTCVYISVVLLLLCPSNS